MKAYYADQEIYALANIKYKIIAITLKNGKNKFIISSCQDNSCKRMSSSEVIANKNILLFLSKDDITDICFDAGRESIMNEMNILKDKKSPQKIVYLHNSEKSQP